jgi:hydroxypyruvate isomerase
MRFAANLSILFTELAPADRPAAARAAGFDAVEFWWPFPTAGPSAADVAAFVTAISDAGIQLVALNFFAADMAAGERGVVSWPGREDEFRASVRTAVDIGERLGCRLFNALYGNRLPNVDSEQQDALAARNLGFAAEAVGPIGGTVLLEPLSGAPAYPLRTSADAIAAIDRARAASGRSNIGLLADLYHLGVNGDDVTELVTVHSRRIDHVQIADAPGRHEPGTGGLDLVGGLRLLAEESYHGYVAAEYQPTGRTVDSLGWLAEFRAKVSAR